MSVLIAIPIILLFSLVVVRGLMAWGAADGVAARVLAGPPLAGEKPGEPGHTPLWKVFFWALALRLALLGAAALYTTLIGGGEFSWEGFAGKFTLWDARHYINLIDKGYMAYQEDGRHIFLVFYPLYVWLVRLVRLAVPDTIVAGVMVSVASFAWGCCWVYRLAGMVFGRKVAQDAVLFLGTFPFSFFFGTVMTEGLFLLTTSAACFFALKRRWLAFGLWGALAALTRMTGVLVMLPALMELLREAQPLAAPRRPLKSWLLPALKRLPLLMMPLLGAGGYLLLNWRVDGDPLAFLGHQAHWHQGGMAVPRVLMYLWDYLLQYAGEPMGWCVWLPELVMFAGFFVVLMLAARQRQVPASLLCYSFAYLMANYSLSWLLSAGRYLSCGFPLFILLAFLVGRRPFLRGALLAAQAALLGVYLFAYINNAPVM